ncbi:MAG: LysM domain-containing protein [Chloroflexota bacterium]
MRKNLYVQLTLVSLLMLLAVVFFVLPQKYGTNVQAQATYKTSTPGADGRIIYVVQEGDNCTRVFLLTGVEISQLIALNGLGADCAIFPGDELILGILESPNLTETANTSPTPGDTLPSPTPPLGIAEVCIVLFDDVDGNGMRTEEELYLGGGAVSINNRSGTISLTGDTIGGDPELVEPLCFLEVPEGEYNISVAIPDGYNPTTAMNYALTLQAGDQATLGFGVQTASNVISSGETSGGRSPLLGIAGLFIFLGGLGLGYYTLRSRKS